MKVTSEVNRHLVYVQEVHVSGQCEDKWALSKISSILILGLLYSAGSELPNFILPQKVVTTVFSDSGKDYVTSCTTGL